MNIIFILTMKMQIILLCSNNVKQTTVYICFDFFDSSISYLGLFTSLFFILQKIKGNHLNVNWSLVVNTFECKLVDTNFVQTINANLILKDGNVHKIVVLRFLFLIPCRFVSLSPSAKVLCLSSLESSINSFLLPTYTFKYCTVWIMNAKVTCNRCELNEG